MQQCPRNQFPFSCPFDSSFLWDCPIPYIWASIPLHIRLLNSHAQMYIYIYIYVAIPINAYITKNPQPRIAAFLGPRLDVFHMDGSLRSWASGWDHPNSDSSGFRVLGCKASGLGSTFMAEGLGLEA